MGKKVSLAEKKKKLEVEDIKKKEKYRVEIVCDEEDNISVVGAIENFNLFMKIITGAINAVNNHDIFVFQSAFYSAFTSKKLLVT